MSRTYAIACKKCRVSLWIGQGWPHTRRYIYTGMPKVMKALSDFLYAHETHELVFDDTERLVYEDYTEIDVGELPESEGQSSEAITSTETSGFPARQSGSPGVDPLGERQVCGMDLGNGHKCSGPKDHPPGIHQYEVDFL